MASLAEIWIKFSQNFFSCLLDIDIKTFENPSGHAVSFAQETQQNMFRPNICVIQGFGLSYSQCQAFLYTRRVRNVSDDLLVRSGAYLSFDFLPDGFEIQPKLLQHINGDALAQPDDAK